MNDLHPNRPRLGESGLEGFAPYLMNRIMGRYNAALRAEMARHGLTTKYPAGASADLRSHP